MKQNIKNYLFIITTLLFFTFITSLILTILFKKEVISNSTSLIIANVSSYILFAIASFILGYKNKKHGLIHGILLSILMIILSIAMGNDISNIIVIIKMITKSLIIIFFTILGVNKRNL